jgi:hypothetical protein
MRGPCRSDGACRWAGHRTPASRRRFTSDAPAPAALPSVRHRNPPGEFSAPQSIPGDPARPACGGKIRRGSQAHTLRGIAATRHPARSSRLSAGRTAAVAASRIRDAQPKAAFTARPPDPGTVKQRRGCPSAASPSYYCAAHYCAGCRPCVSRSPRARRLAHRTLPAGHGKGAAPASRGYAIHPAQSGTLRSNPKSNPAVTAASENVKVSRRNP